MKGNDTAFYSAVAGLVPVLLFAGLVVLERFNVSDARGTRSDTWTTLWLVAGVLLSAALAEGAALSALLSGARKSSASSVTLTLLVLFVIVAVGALRPVLANLQRHGVGDAMRRGSQVVFGLAGVGMLLCAVAFLHATF